MHFWSCKLSTKCTFDKLIKPHLSQYDTKKTKNKSLPNCTKTRTIAEEKKINTSDAYNTEPFYLFDLFDKINIHDFANQPS